MESLGEKLKKARDQKACTLEQVARDTNIARRYLEALEAEDFSIFPGEPYLLGFLRNYGEYLGIESQELVSAYRTLKIQEQPIPVEQLLHDPKPRFVVPLVAGLLVCAGIVAAAVFWLLPLLRSQPSTMVVAERTPVQYELKSDALEQRMYIGDTILVSRDADQYKFSLSKLSESVTLASPLGDMVLDLGQETRLDLNNDGNADLLVFVADLFKNNPDKGAVLRLELLELVVAEELPSEDLIPVTSIQELGPQAADELPALISSSTAFPFTLQATFRGYCLFRWEADRNEREERYFHKAETLTMQAQNGIRVWISNASAVKLVAIGGGRTVNVDVGNAGEVVVADVRWVRDEDGRFRLTLIRLD